MTSSAGAEGPSRGRPSKVATLIEKYDLDGIGAEMEQRWTAEEDRRSLRDLAADFNQALLSAAVTAAGVTALDGELENVYRLLTDDDVGRADRTRARRRLERDGVDVDGLLEDFVTYQAIRTYLTKHRGAEYTPDDTDPIEREIETVEGLRGRVSTVTEGKLEQLRDGDELTLGAFRVITEVRVICEECNVQRTAVELLEDGGCECDD